MSRVGHLDVGGAPKSRGCTSMDSIMQVKETSAVKAEKMRKLVRIPRPSRVWHPATSNMTRSRGGGEARNVKTPSAVA